MPLPGPAAGATYARRRFRPARFPGTWFTQPEYFTDITPRLSMVNLPNSGPDILPGKTPVPGDNRFTGPHWVRNTRLLWPTPLCASTHRISSPLRHGSRRGPCLNRLLMGSGQTVRDVPSMAATVFHLQAGCPSYASSSSVGRAWPLVQQLQTLPCPPSQRHMGQYKTDASLRTFVPGSWRPATDHIFFGLCSRPGQVSTPPVSAEVARAANLPTVPCMMGLGTGL